MLRFSKLRLAGLQHRKTEAHIYKALQMPQSISGAKTSSKWLTPLLFGVEGRGTSPHPEALPRHNTPLPLLTHPSSSRFLYSGHNTQQHLLPFELTKPFPWSRDLRVPGGWSRAGKEPQLLLPWSRTGREPRIFLPQPIMSLSTQACAAASRDSSGIFTGVRSTVAHPSPAVFASCFLFLLCSPRF